MNRGTPINAETAKIAHGADADIDPIAANVNAGAVVNSLITPLVNADSPANTLVVRIPAIWFDAPLFGFGVGDGTAAAHCRRYALSVVDVVSRTSGAPMKLVL